MQKNSCYENRRPPVREEVQLQDKAKPTDVRFKMTDSISRSNADNTNCSTFNKKEINLKAKCIGLVVVFSVLAIAMVAAIALSAYALVSSNQGMDSLMKENQELKMQLNKTKEASETKIANLNRDLTRIETDGLNTLTATNNATMALLNSIQSSVSTLEGVLSGLGPGQVSADISSLQSSVSSLNTANGATRTQLNSIRSSVSSLNTANGATTTQLNSLQSSVRSLTTRVNSPVNLYQNCIQETRSFTGTPLGNTYWKKSYSPSLPVNKTVRC